MRTAILGSHPHLLQRAEVLHEESAFQGRLEDASAVGPVDLCFIGVSTGQRFGAASAALRAGSSVFLEWPPASSLEECERLVRLAEEAGLEAAVSRPLRVGLVDVEEGWRADITSVDVQMGSSLTQTLADVVDMASTLARSGSVRRVDAEAAYDERRELVGSALSLRYHNGALAQALIRTQNGPHPGFRLYAAGRGRTIDRLLKADATSIAAETRNVCGALAAGRRLPVSALDALHTLRIVERLMNVLR